MPHKHQILLMWVRESASSPARRAGKWLAWRGMQRWQKPREPDIVHQAEHNPMAACRELSPTQPAVCVPLHPCVPLPAGHPIGASLNACLWCSYMSYTCSQRHLRETTLSFPRFGLWVFLLLHFILFFFRFSTFSGTVNAPACFSCFPHLSFPISFTVLSDEK